MLDKSAALRPNNHDDSEDLSALNKEQLIEKIHGMRKELLAAYIYAERFKMMMHELMKARYGSSKSEKVKISRDDKLYTIDAFYNFILETRPKNALNFEVIMDEDEDCYEKLDAKLAKEFAKEARATKQAALEEAFEEAPTNTRKKPKNAGRKPLPEHLEREEQEYKIADEQKCDKCSGELHEMGKVETEYLELVPAKLKVVKRVRFKYCCRNCEEQVLLAQAPKLPIKGSTAGPGLLADIVCSKFQNHLPLYRIERKFKDDFNCKISRGSMAFWLIKIAKLLDPFYQKLIQIINNYDVVYCDETKLQVLKEADRRPQQLSWLWSFVGGSSEQKSCVYVYDTTRSAKVVHNTLPNFSGFLHCDGYSCYKAYKSAKNDKNKEADALQKIKLVGCWYHVRRKFFNITQIMKPAESANFLLDKIRQLSEIEAEAKDNNFSIEAIKNIRQVESKPIIDEIKKELDRAIAEAPLNGVLYKAAQYALNQWQSLLTFLDDGRLEISNNLSERVIKSAVIGRKNWLFSDTVDGAAASATLLSLVETCRMNNINPSLWFQKILTEFPNIDCSDPAAVDAAVENLMPYQLAQRDLQELLESSDNTEIDNIDSISKSIHLSLEQIPDE